MRTRKERILTTLESYRKKWLEADKEREKRERVIERTRKGESRNKEREEKNYSDPHMVRVEGTIINLLSLNRDLRLREVSPRFTLNGKDLRAIAWSSCPRQVILELFPSLFISI